MINQPNQLPYKFQIIYRFMIAFLSYYIYIYIHLTTNPYKNIVPKICKMMMDFKVNLDNYRLFFVNFL